MFEKFTNVRSTLLTLLLLCCIQGYSQTGPGGVSDDTGNQFWFDVVDLNLNDGQRVQNWVNRGSNSENLYQTKFARSPLYKNTSSYLNNGFPSVLFDGLDDVLKLKDNDELNLKSNPDTDRSYSFVFKTGADVLQRQNIYDEGGNKRGINMYIYNDSLYVGAWNLKAADGPDAPWGFYFSKAKVLPNQQYVVSIIFQGNSSKTGTIRCYINNEIFGTINNVGQLYPHDVGAGWGNIKGKTRFEAPTNVVNGNRGFTGTVSEWMFFTHDYSEAERMIVENYLAGKYDIQFPTNLYTQRTFHQHEIIGVGQADDGTTHTNSQAKGILSISNPDSLDDGDFLFIGHNNYSLEYVKTCPEDVSRRLNRVWRVTEVSEVGNLTIKFDLTGLGELPTDASEFILLVDSDGDFTNAESRAVGASLNGNEITFNDVDLDWSDFVTLGIWKTINWDGSAFNNGTGAGNAPSPADMYRKFVVNSSINVATLPESGSVDCMVVKAGAKLTIPTEASLTVHNTIDNNGLVIVEEDAELIQTHDGINMNTGNGAYQMTRTGLQTPNGFNAWSSPMSNSDILGTFPNVNPCDLYFFDSDRQNWYYDFAPGTSVTCNGNPVTFNGGQLIPGADGIFNPGFGYFVPGSTTIDSVRTFTGKANNGIISVPIYQQINPTNVKWTGDDWNLVGNPYISAIDAEDFWQENAINNPKIIGAIYYWDDDDSGGAGYNENDDYASWNLLGGTAASSGKIPNGYISSGQGFWIIANMTSNVIFNNSMRGGNNTQFFKGESNPLNASRLWVSIETPNTSFNQILVGLSDSASAGYDAQVDAHKIEGNPKIMFGSMIDGETDPFIIQGIPTMEPDETKEVSLFIKTDDPGIHHFNLDKIDNFQDGYSFFIRDNESQKIHNIQNGPFAAYLDSAGVYKNRFDLILKREDVGPSNGGGTTSVDENSISEFINVHQQENALIVDYYLESQLQNISVLNIKGQELIKKTATNTNGVANINVSSLSSGIYFVKLESNSGSKVQKVFIQ